MTFEVIDMASGETMVTVGSEAAAREWMRTHRWREWRREWAPRRHGEVSSRTLLYVEPTEVSHGL